MKTRSKTSAYIVRSSAAALLLSCVVVALCSAINLPNHAPKGLTPDHSAAFGVNAHESVPSMATSTLGRSRTLSFAERVAYQRAIEDVYWRHRIWPRERHDSKPSLDAVMSQAQMEKKVADYLRTSQALQDYWQRPITAEQLQAEMDRMASHTKQPEVLRELFEALGNDPFVIAECLARPILAERMLAEYEGGSSAPPLDGKSNREAINNAWPWALATIARGAADPPDATYILPEISDTCADNSWTATAIQGVGRYRHTTVWTGTEMIVW